MKWLLIFLIQGPSGNEYAMTYTTATHAECEAQGASLINQTKLIWMDATTAFLCYPTPAAQVAYVLEEPST